MKNIRLITDNSADRGTITVPNTASGMGSDKLKTDVKGEACRILSSSGSIIITWSQLETVGAVVIPASNLGPSSTIRVRAYLDTAGTTLLADSGTKFAAPGTILEYWDFSQPLNVNAFADGTSPITACYLPEQVAVRRLVIDITNPDNTFIDLSRLVVGAYHALSYNPDYGVTTGTLDLSKNTRAASGDIKTDWGPKASSMTFDLGWVANADRERVKQLIARGVGRFLFVSIFPENDDPVLERDYSIYGKPSQVGSMTYSLFNLHSSQFQIEGF